MLNSYGHTVGRTVLVVLGVLAALAAIYLAVIGTWLLVRYSHHPERGPVVTVTTTS